jgi:hypothetical protein
MECFKNTDAWPGEYFLILMLGTLRQENHEFEASLGYIERHCLKKKPKTTTRKSNCLDPTQRVLSVGLESG